MAIFNFGGWSWPRRGTGASDKDNFTTEPTYLKHGVRELTPETATKVSAVLCAARVISQGVAQVPFKLMLEEDKNGRIVRRPARENPIYELLAYRPNDFMTSFTFRETLMMHAVLAHGGYAYISRGANGKPRELIPLNPNDVGITYDQYDGKRYIWRRNTVDEQAFSVQDILHIHGPSYDGLIGAEIMNVARSAIGLSSSLEKAQIDLANNGARPSGVLYNGEGQHVSEERIKAIKDRWDKSLGAQGSGGVVLLDGSWDFKTLQMNSVDSQHIETREFQIREVARFMMVFPQMLMANDKTSTYASAEQFFLAHVMHTLDPWMDRFEQAVKLSVVGFKGESSNLFPKLFREGLLRGASKDRAEYYQRALGLGGTPAWLTQNEVRELEDRNPLEGDDYNALPKPLNATFEGGAPNSEAEQGESDGT